MNTLTSSLKHMKYFQITVGLAILLMVHFQGKCERLINTIPKAPAIASSLLITTSAVTVNGEQLDLPGEFVIDKSGFQWDQRNGKMVEQFTFSSVLILRSDQVLSSGLQVDFSNTSVKGILTLWAENSPYIA